MTQSRRSTCDIAEVSESRQEGVSPYAVDPGSAGRLWTLSAQLTGVDAIPLA